MKRDGQVIILTILIIGGTLLSASSLAGLLMLYQIRQATDLGNSGKAIMAADSGVEWAMYERFNPGQSGFFKKEKDQSGNEVWKASLSNGSEAEVKCFKDAETKPCDDPDVNIIRSWGSANNTTRSFRLSF